MLEMIAGGLLLAFLGAVYWLLRTGAQLRSTSNLLSASEAKLQVQQELQARLQADLSQLEDEKAQLNEQFYQAQQAAALAEQQAQAARTQLAEQVEQLRADREAFMQHAKASAFETGQQLSSKLLEDHKREREETHKKFEQFTKLASDQLTEKQQELAATLGKVQGQVNDSREQLSVLVRSMQNPIGAGAEGEIIMGNILQQHGFTAGQDYELQVHLASEEGALRPDCVIYLPHQHAIIVDSKASQHIFALFRAEGTLEFDDKFKEIQTSMRQHAKALAGKAYRESLAKLKNRHGEPITRTTLVMFVPNDEVVTRLMHKDPNLMQYMREQDIILAGPVTLSGIFLSSRALIREARQIDAQAEILSLTSELMADLSTALGYAEDVMKGIRGSASAYDKFAASLNRGVMARLKRLAIKGVNPAKNKALPKPLARYEIHRQDDVLQHESDEAIAMITMAKDDAA